ncbi:hypothetical protein OG497_37765 [Streptomyces sp. NBC_01242]|uniref:hypothetical protein n=1 Tax=Streptomyces sp. NBC_01242 TaxID=2903795 RepID=UPI00225B14E8|nr:hypothetical protein [Streptomyces sp. NBC_01242]MCX4799606.1 hypothetical protein [Streptomyces sp. NBC_01242]
MRIRIIATAAVTVILASVTVGCSSAPHPDSAPHPTQQGAAVMCEGFVKKRLKSPGTAKFSGVTETKIETLSNKKPWSYQVTAWVDSQNTYGGVVRNDYVCTISTEDDKTWTLAKDIKFTSHS